MMQIMKHNTCEITNEITILHLNISMCFILFPLKHSGLVLMTQNPRQNRSYTNIQEWLLEGGKSIYSGNYFPWKRRRDSPGRNTKKQATRRKQDRKPEAGV